MTDYENRWDDPEVIRELYHEEGMSLREIGDELGCSRCPVRQTMIEHDITRRDNKDVSGEWKKLTPCHFRTRPERGHEAWSSQVDGVTHTVSVHRILAVSEMGTDAVKGKDVHHKNGIPWDNRPENIELMDPGEHSSLHSQEVELEFGEDGDIVGHKP